MANWLVDKQNDPGILRWLAGSSDRYGRAKRLLIIQAALAVVIPMVLSILKVIEPHLGVWAAFYGAIITIFDLFVLDHRLREYLRQGALAQESFDCKVLALVWNEIRAGVRPTQADFIEWSSDSLQNNPDQSWYLNWYPIAAGTIPIELGRIICQLSNCRWDSRLRKRYAIALFGSAITFTLVIFTISLAVNITVQVLLLTLFSVLPAIIWPLRGWKAQNESVESANNEKKRLEELWSEALKGELKPDRIEYTSRSVQDEIFTRRKGSQPVFNWVYRRFRHKDELNMNLIADAMVVEYQKSMATKTGNSISGMSDATN